MRRLDAKETVRHRSRLGVGAAGAAGAGALASPRPQLSSHRHSRNRARIATAATALMSPQLHPCSHRHSCNCAHVATAAPLSPTLPAVATCWPSSSRRPRRRSSRGRTAIGIVFLCVLWCLRQGGSGVPVLEERLGGGYVEGTGEQEALSAVAVLGFEQG